MGGMHASVYRQLQACELVGVSDRNPERAAKFGREHGCPVFETQEALTEAVDAVDVCLPTDLHSDASVAALAAGRHVFCEKPMALTLEEADRMISAADAAGKQLMIGHCIRFWPEYALLKETCDEGRLGGLASLNLTRYGAFPSWSAENWLADETRAGGGALDMHIHDTDFALYLLGEPDSMTSRGTVDARGVSQIFTTMMYGPTIVHLEGGWNLPAGTPFKMAFRAIFEHGAMIMDAGPLTVYEDGKEPIIPKFQSMKAEGGGNISDLGGYYHELSYFVEKVGNNEPLETVTPQSSRLSLATALEEIRLAKAPVK